MIKVEEGWMVIEYKAGGNHDSTRWVIVEVEDRVVCSKIKGAGEASDCRLENWSVDKMATSGDKTHPAQTTPIASCSRLQKQPCAAVLMLREANG